jgi:formylglycine-generating enzyme required for sulfatase activity
VATLDKQQYSVILFAMKKLMFILLILMSVHNLFAKDKLAILPFTGGNGDEGEGIAERFSYSKELASVFNIIPHTSIVSAVRKERNFQMNSGMTNPDTIASIGYNLGARYVVAGNITKLGVNKILIISILRIEDLQQIAGDIQAYKEIDDVLYKLPSMAKTIVTATKLDTKDRSKLAIVPLELKNFSKNSGDADVLAQILSVYIVQSGKYAVYPRTQTLEQIEAETKIQMNGDTLDSEVARVGAGDNPEYVLSCVARQVGKTNTFNASIIHIETGLQELGDSVDYTNLNDSIDAMNDLARRLTGIVIAKTPTPKEPPVRPPPPPEKELKPVPPKPDRRPPPSASLVRIIGGTFTMGGSTGDWESPLHTVTVSDFSIGNFEVTQKEWVEVMGNNPSKWKGDKLPVEQVSWYDAVEYCNRRSQKEGLTPVYTINKFQEDVNNKHEDDDLKWTVTWNKDADGYRLPTEAEWEYACRAGTISQYYTGSTISTSQANFSEKNAKSNKTWNVGSGVPNAIGLYDMSGNVYEWCWDWLDYYQSGNQYNPNGASSGSFRVLRGGSWYDNAQYLRSSYRGDGYPASRDDTCGFRVVRN